MQDLSVPVLIINWSARRYSTLRFMIITHSAKYPPGSSSLNGYIKEVWSSNLLRLLSILPPPKLVRKNCKNWHFQMDFYSLCKFFSALFAHFFATHFVLQICPRKTNRFLKSNKKVYKWHPNCINLFRTREKKRKKFIFHAHYYFCTKVSVVRKNIY